MNGNPIEYIQWSVLGKQNTIQRVLLTCIWGLISGFDKKDATELYKKKKEWKCFYLSANNTHSTALGSFCQKVFVSWMKITE